jgi:monoterpene epsilon-lactone hydrolase
MSIEQNKTTARLYIEEGIAKANAELVRGFFADAASSYHQRFRIKESAFQAYSNGVAQRSALDPFVVTVDAMIAEGDTVVVYWHYDGVQKGWFHGAPPTGNNVTAHTVGIFRFRDGKIVSTDMVADRLAVFKQFGSLGDYLPVFFGDEQLDAKLPLHKDLRPRSDRPELADAAAQAVAPFRHIRAGDDVVDAIRSAMGQHNPPSPPPVADDVDFLPVEINGIKAEWVRPKSRSGLNRIVHCHGGGWVAGGIGVVRSRSIELARAAKADVLIFNYRLAPEHPFPAGLEDCKSVFAWAGENGPDGADAVTGERPALALSGDSAGATLAVATCADAVTGNGPKPQSLVLLSGQLTVVPHFDRVARQDQMVIPDRLWYVYNVYTQDVPATDPRISPLYTPLETLALFPRTLIQVSGDELVLWDARKMTERMISADVRCVLSVWPEMIHCWHSLLSVAPEAKQALQEAATFITSA